MKKVLAPLLLAICAFVAILSPWSNAALARVNPTAEAPHPTSSMIPAGQPEFSFSRGGYRHAMPTWRQ